MVTIVTGICHECGKRLCDTHVDGTVGGNPVKYHHICAERLPEPVTAQAVGFLIQGVGYSAHYTGERT